MDLVLKRFLLLLHPFMPHLTEELWEKIGYGEAGGPTFLMQTILPTEPVLAGADPAAVAKARARVAAVYEAVGRARNLKAEYGLGATKGVKFIVDTEEGSFPESTVFARLVGAGEILVSPGYEAAQGVPAALTAIGKIYLPLEGLIDVAAERERLGKERDKAQDELKKVNAKLSNENFVTRAPEEVIGEMKERQKHWHARVDELEKMMGNLGS
jgi:valyl-tRNA synthetase